jgi:hypothetical protein
MRPEVRGKSNKSTFWNHVIKMESSVTTARQLIATVCLILVQLPLRQS